MSHRVIRQGRLRHEYKVFHNADNWGEAVHCRFSPRDRWVGHNYWWHIRTYEPSRKERAFSLMSRFEHRKQTHRLGYQLARCVVLTEMGFGVAAQTNFQNWRRGRESDDIGFSGERN